MLARALAGTECTRRWRIIFATADAPNVDLGARIQLIGGLTSVNEAEFTVRVRVVFRDRTFTTRVGVFGPRTGKAVFR